MATHTNIGAMLGDLNIWIQAHPGCVVLSADDLRAFEVGFTASTVDNPMGEAFFVSISARRLLDQCSPDLAAYFRSVTGRQTLAKILENPVPSKIEEAKGPRPVYPTSWEHLLEDDPV